MWLHLKKVLLTKDCVAFNDAKGGWFVTIDITPTNIIVVHRVWRNLLDLTEIRE